MASPILQPTPVPPTAAEVYDLLYYTQQLDSRFVQFLTRNLNRYAPGRRVLDCACGTGEPSIYLAKHFDVVACDADHAMLRLALGKAKNSGSKLTHICAARWNSLPFRRASHFDAVICCGNSIGQLQSFGDLRSSLAEMADVLVSRGVLYIDFRIDYSLDRPDFVITDLAGPVDYKGRQLVIAIFERHVHGVVERVKVCYYNESDRLIEVRRVATRYNPFRTSELRHELALAGFKRIRLLRRPGRWPLLALLAAKA